jgi:hypothetical protein
MKEDATGYLVVERDQLPDSELQGYLFGGANVCLIFVDIEPGDGPRLHRHAYEETSSFSRDRRGIRLGQRPSTPAPDRC